MNKTILPADERRIEQALLTIAAKIADATELSQRAKEMAISSERLLISAQQDLENLYLSLAPHDAPRLTIYRDVSHS